jgi:hypothetical protein
MTQFSLSTKEQVEVGFLEGGDTAWRLIISREKNSTHFCFALHWGDKEVPTHFGMIPLKELMEILTRMSQPQVVE